MTIPDSNIDLYRRDIERFHAATTKVLNRLLADGILIRRGGKLVETAKAIRIQEEWRDKKIEHFSRLEKRIPHPTK